MALARFLACRARLASASLMASLAATTRSRAFHALEPTGPDSKGIVLLLLHLPHHNLTLARPHPARVRLQYRLAAALGATEPVKPKDRAPRTRPIPTTISPDRQPPPVR